MQGIERELRTYILENYFLDQDKDLSNADSFMRLGVIDSTGVLELVSYLEERYGIEVAAEELIPENLDSVDNLARFVQCKLDTSDCSSRVSSDMPTKNELPARSNA